MRNYKIINLQRAEVISQESLAESKSVVLVGGVFDLLHYGHLKFLQAAKLEGDVLIVALESDANVRRRKGNNRPLNSGQIRAEVLAALEVVDYVLILPEMRAHQDYFALVQKLRPDVIAVTACDPQLENKKRQAQSVGGVVKVVTAKLAVPSTTQLAKILEVE